MPNSPYGCEPRWTPGYGGQPGAFGPGGAQEYGPENLGPTTYSLTQIGPRNDVKQSHLVPGKGTVGFYDRVAATINPGIAGTVKTAFTLRGKKR